MTDIKFRSGYEKRVFQNAQKQGRALEYEPSEPELHYHMPKRYYPDYRLPNGVIIEAKGYFRPADRAKMLRVKKENPSYDIRFLFQRPNMKLSKAKNSIMYWQWAERHGFPWAGGETIPAHWWARKREDRDKHEDATSEEGRRKG